MKRQDLYEKMSLIDEKIIEKNSAERFKRSRKPLFISLIAAAIALSMLTAVILPGMIEIGESTDEPTQETELPSSLPLPTVLKSPSGTIGGMPSKHIGDTELESKAGYDEMLDPRVPVDDKCAIVAVKAAELLPDTYSSLTNYGNIKQRDYRIFRMRVIDPMGTDFKGEFYYALRSDLFCDLREYDQLILAVVYPHYSLYLNQASGEITRFEHLFFSLLDRPDRCNLIAFTDSVLDPSVFYTEGWQNIMPNLLDDADGYGEELSIVRYGMSFEESVSKIKQRRTEFLDSLRDSRYFDLPFEYRITSAESLKAIDHYKSPDNGVYGIIYNGDTVTATRYINGCPTNEFLKISRRSDGTETLEYSEFKFDTEDMDALVDISAYIEALDLSSLPQPTLDAYMNTPSGDLTLGYSAAAGWYEKTESGVESFVSVFRIYTFNDSKYSVYLDAMHIRLTTGTPEFLDCKALEALIGNNQYASNYYMEAAFYPLLSY